jgi:hypothetical protein
VAHWQYSNTMLRIIFALTLVTITRSFPSGAPDKPEVCRTMLPGHKNSSPQTRPAPFKITVNRDSFKASESLRVTLQMTDGEKFQGFMIQARLADTTLPDSLLPIGNFQTSDGRTSPICVGGAGSALTHVNGSISELKTQMNFDWHSPSSSQGHIIFKITVVLTHDRYWVAEPSKVIMDLQAPPMAKTTQLTPPLPAEPITEVSCGKTKSCYRNPPGCVAAQCDILAVWNDGKDYIDFQLTADSEGWVAIGFSEDMKMGTDEVFECAWNESESQVNIRHSRNRADKKDNLIVPASLGLHNKVGWVTNRRISCYFRRDKVVSGQGSLFNDRYHLLLAKGQVDKKGGKLRHTLEANKYPYVSTQKVKMSDRIDITHTARYILVKVHGCLMLIGWMMCASTALILTKYYKPMWPNDRLCGTKVWLAVHTGCMITCLLCTIVAFILIFIHAGGYSQMPDYPDKAHPPLGICTTILCILNPLIAICRPSDKAKWRPIFNWIHWLFGTCGAVLASMYI